MDANRFGFVAGVGCVSLILLMLIVIPGAFISFSQLRPSLAAPLEDTPQPGVGATQEALPTMTLPAPAPNSGLPPRAPGLNTDILTGLYEQSNPGVVNINILVSNGTTSSQGAGSGFVLDEAGHIITNYHVIMLANNLTVGFFDGREALAVVVGVDVASDLAVLKVTELPDGVYPLPLGNSDEVRVGEWVMAIGNPFGLSSSMSVGVVSAVGRLLDSGSTPFSLPQVIQTDAAINPGNSGGPLINMNGQVIGVNSQIATSGPLANAGVGFAIPSNLVRRVAPVLIERGEYQWAWLGASGGDVTLALMHANELQTQEGVYVDVVLPNSPASKAGLQGSTRTTSINGVETPTGGDVILEANGEAVNAFTDLLIIIASLEPGQELALTVLRDGQRLELSATLEARPANIEENFHPSANANPRGGDG